jgi:hypothetical protein
MLKENDRRHHNLSYRPTKKSIDSNTAWDIDK